MKKFITLVLLIVLLPLIGWSQLNENPSKISVPVLLKKKRGQGHEAGFVSVEATKQKRDAITILRRQLQADQIKAQRRAKKDGVVLSTTKHLPVEFITFQILMGAVTFETAYIKSSGDPLKMIHFIESIKDPVGIISFGAFMATQGIYMNSRTGSAKFLALDPSTKSQLMRRFAYSGMAFGSMASSLVSDVGQTAVTCAKAWINGKENNQALAACDQAWNTWNWHGKFTQYFPQVISMWASQAAAEMLEGGLRRGFTHVGNFAVWADRVLARKFAANLATKITGADIVLTFVGGGWVTKSIKLVGKVTRLGGFIVIDQILASYTYPLVNAVMLPAAFQLTATKIDKLWAEADKGNWNLKSTKRAPYVYCDKVDCKSIDQGVQIDDFENAIDKYGERMQQWRDNLNSDADTDLNGWMEMTKKLLSQVQLSYSYYSKFIGELNYTLNTAYRVKQKTMDASAWNIATQYPTRILPFYGVKIGDCQFVNNTMSQNIADHLLVNPQNIEPCQRDHILKTAQQLKNASTEVRSHPKDFTAYSFIISQLISNDPLKMAAGLREMNIVIGTYRSQSQQDGGYTYYSHSYAASLIALKKALGDPEPQIFPMQAFAKVMNDTTETQELQESADYSTWSAVQNYMFNSEYDFINYKMICGEQQSKIYKIQYKGVNLSHPQFEPPSILNANSARSEFCKTSKDSYGFYKKIVNGLELKNYMYKNLNLTALGDFKNDDPADARIFEIWWLQNAKRPINKEFKAYDQKYREIFNLSKNNFNGQFGRFKSALAVINRSPYLNDSIKNSIKAETSFYLQVLNRSFMNDTVKLAGTAPVPPKVDTSTWSGWFKDKWNKTKATASTARAAIHDSTIGHNYLKFTTDNATRADFKSMYNIRVREVTALNQLFLKYYSFIANQYTRNNKDYKACVSVKAKERNEALRNKALIVGEITNESIYTKCDFDQYIGVSKEIDTAINNLLVIQGLKKLVPGQISAVDSFDDGTSSETGTAVSNNTYEDIAVQKPNYKQRTTAAAVRGLRKVQNELSRYVRMKYSLSSRLELNDQEFQADIAQIRNSPRQNTRSFSPAGN